jgi:hypothetical protein
MVNIKLVDKLYKIAMVQDGIESERDIIHAFAELIVLKCAAIASNTNLEDVDGGDSAVLGAAREQILEHFGVE